MNRKKFFTTTGLGVFGLMIMNKFPFSLFNKSSKKVENPVKVKINPSAVSRKNR